MADTDHTDWSAFPPTPEFLRPVERHSDLELSMIALSEQLRATIWTIRFMRAVAAITVLGVAFLGCEVAAVLWHAGPLWWWTR